MLQTADTIQQLEQKIGYCFKDKSLLRQALTHSSFSNEQKINKQKNYERLEFLGDAVLELVSSQYFFSTYPNMPEGQMTRLRASTVCEPVLAMCAREMGLEEFIMLGRGEEHNGGRQKDAIVSDVMEAVIGAVFLEGGLPQAEKFINRFILLDMENKRLFIDSKTVLQELIQQERSGPVRYQLVTETGPEHDKVFLVELYLRDQKISQGTGKNRKSAEQQAAYEALKQLKK